MEKQKKPSAFSVLMDYAGDHKVLTYLSFALAFWLATFTGTALAFFIIALLYLLLLILFFFFRKPWIEKPLVRFLASLLLSK